MATRSVILTADDFGLLPEVNEAVITGYDNGVLTGAGLRVTAVASHAAVVAASMRPGLGVGLHLVLCEGRATLPRRHIPNLVDTTGMFPSRPLEAAWLYRRGGGLRDELRSEIRAQVEKFLATGLELSYISGHMHMHLHPTVLSILKELATQYPIVALRKPCGGIARRAVRHGTQGSIETALMRPMLGWSRMRARRFVGPKRVDLLSPDRPATEHAVAERIKRLRSGVTELVCHPGSLQARFDGVGEAAVVASSVVRAALEDAQVEPVSYRNLVEDF